ncbi:MAG: methylmalonyl Co-A mutase-associated GTPase MeaB [Dehalococcoidia bacterium]|nr:methylmalonyl Co-A mutase-associated GTPase MeaB [Dehalococcoidia bacterium]
MDVADLIAGVRVGDRRALARAISHVEADSITGRALLAALYQFTGKAATVGVTGSAGVGKSTFVAALAREERRRGHTVGIVAVDPSSPFSNGAILGDRIRMQDLTSDGGVFMRSMASRGNLGGLSEMATGVVDLMDVAGFEIVILETVGAGQDEVEVATATGTTVLVTTPAGGDDIQSMKAGLMEIAQVLVVNKADIAGADTAVMQLRSLLAIATERTWEPPILKTTARAELGLAEVADAIDRHQAHLKASDHARDERRALVQSQIVALARGLVQRRALAFARAEGILAGLVDEVAERRRDPRAAADALVDAVQRHWGRASEG